MTPIGSLMRRFSLDELPELFNDSKGDMSLVGPKLIPKVRVSETLCCTELQVGLKFMAETIFHETNASK